MKIRGLLVGLGAAALAHPLAYLGMFAGDAEIHLVFARSAAAGRFFEFNPGEAVAGETSPGYMLLVAALFRLAPETWVPVLMKAGGLAAWYALVALTFLAARRLLASTPLALACAATLALMPGSAYNATTGMENGLFALVVLAVVWAAARFAWWDGRGPDLALDASLGAALGLACWLRPEGFVVAALAIACRAAHLAAARGPRAAVRGAGAALAAAAPIAASVVLFHHAFTGRFVPVSGLARVTGSAARGVHLLGLSLDAGLAERLAAYWPLTAGLAVATWAFATGRDRTERPGAFRFALLLVWTFLGLYGAVLGAFHVARYILFLTPALVVAAAHGARWLWRRWPGAGRWRAAAAAVCLVWLASVFAAEVVERRGLGGSEDVAKACGAPLARRQYSDTLFEAAGRPTELPVVIACQEVQVRYWLDDRFVVRSLDGRVDPVLLDFVRDGNYDHIGYLKERGVRFLFSSFNDYDRDPGPWSLARLNGLEVGESEVHGGLRFTRVDVMLVRVDPEGEGR